MIMALLYWLPKLMQYSSILESPANYFKIMLFNSAQLLPNSLTQFQ